MNTMLLFLFLSIISLSLSVCLSRLALMSIYKLYIHDFEYSIFACFIVSSVSFFFCFAPSPCFLFVSRVVFLSLSLSLFIFFFAGWQWLRQQGSNVVLGCYLWL